jgi:hypothetical protein
VFQEVNKEGYFLVGVMMSHKEGVIRSKDRFKERVTGITPISFFLGLMFIIIADRERDIMGITEGLDKGRGVMAMVIGVVEMEGMNVLVLKEREETHRVHTTGYGNIKHIN